MKAARPHPRPTPRVGMISLGCAKNLVDAEIMLGSLLKDGMEITNDPRQADALIVNTCSFIDAAQEESVDTILESTELRQAHHPGQALIVSGCLPQRFRDDLPKLLPEVDAFMGIDQVAQVSSIVKEALARRADKVGASPKSGVQNPKSRIVRRFAELDKHRDPKAKEIFRDTDKFGRTKTIVAPPAPTPVPGPLVDVHLRPNYIPDFATPRFRLTPRHFAYVKIAEGCNHPCSFCISPRMRGSHRSRKQSDIVQEARQLIDEGVKDWSLTAQYSAFY